MYRRLQSGFRCAGGLLLVSLLALVVAPARASEGDTVLKYFHGGLHSVVSREDRNVAEFLGNYIDDIRDVETVDFELEERWYILWRSKPGDPREEEITQAIVDNLEESPAKLFLVGYSAGAGTLLDVMAVRHLNQEAQNDRASILEGLKKTESMFILVDPYMGGIPYISSPAPLTEEQKKDITAFLSEGAATAVVILHDNDRKREDYNFLDPVVEKAMEMLKPLSDDRFHVVALEDFNHATIVDDPERQSKEGLTAISTVANHYYLELHPQDGTTGEQLERLQRLAGEHPEWQRWRDRWWVWKRNDGEGWDLDPVPPQNHPPTFTPTSLSETKTVYYGGGGGSGYSRGRYLLMSPAWEHLACLTVTDSDGNDLTISLGSTPEYGMANVFSSRTEKGKYNVTISYQILNDKLREIHESRDDLTDSFTLVADDCQVTPMDRAVWPTPTPGSCSSRLAPTCGLTHRRGVSILPVRSIRPLLEPTPVPNDGAVPTAIPGSSSPCEAWGYQARSCRHVYPNGVHGSRYDG